MHTNWFYQLTEIVATLTGVVLILLKKINKPVKPIVYAVAFSWFVDVVAHQLAHWYHNNLWFYYLSNPVYYALFAWFIYANLSQKITRQFILLCVGLFALFTPVYYLLHPVLQPGVIMAEIVFTGFTLAIMAFFYIGGLFIKQNTSFSLPVIIVVTGMLFYFAFSALYFSVSQYIVNTNTDVKAISNILKRFKILLEVTNIVMYLGITAGLVVAALSTNVKPDNS